MRRPQTRLGRVLLNADSPPRTTGGRRAHPRATGRSPSPNRCPVLLLPSFTVCERGLSESADERRAATRVGKERLRAGKGTRGGRRRARQGGQLSLHVVARVPRPASLRSPLARVLACRGRGKVGRAGPPTSHERAARGLAGSQGPTETNARTHSTWRAGYGASDGEVEPGWEDTAGGGRLGARGRDKRWAE
jgi:hypothetical protein